MTSESSNDRKIVTPAMLKPIHRHFVNIMCTQSFPGLGWADQYCNFSAFIVEVQGRWQVISAGHIFNELLTSVKQGATISHWHIDDATVNASAMPPYPIALNVTDDVLWIHDEVPGLDYACFTVAPLAQRALQAAGIEAISQDHWQQDDAADFPYWLLVGTPEGLLKRNARQITEKVHVTLPVSKVALIPPGMEEREFKRTYAQIDFSSVEPCTAGFDIKGMSGGPIFGLTQPPLKSDYPYRIIGIQSCWNKIDSIAFCDAKIFFDALMTIRSRKCA